MKKLRPVELLIFGLLWLATSVLVWIVMDSYVIVNQSGPILNK